MPTKHCVGAVIYDDSGRIFLMSSPKWKKKVVPGGEIKPGEMLEGALRREIREETGIEITDIEYVGQKVKMTSPDFIDPEMIFVFHDFYARALSQDINPNEEISEYGWYVPYDTLKLDLLDSTREFIQGFINRMA